MPFPINTLTQWQTCSPDDAADLPSYAAAQVFTLGLYVGTSGDVVCIGQDNVAVTWKNVPAGTLLPVALRRVNATGTTALNLVACYRP